MEDYTMEEKLLYHYISQEAIMNIVGENGICLRFSHYDCLNDINEGKDAIKIQQEVCEELLGENEQNDKILKEIYQVTPNFEVIMAPHAGKSHGCKRENGKMTASGSIEIIQTGSIPYICCFSKGKDLLPMWNYYSKNQRYEGYNVGLQIKEGVIYSILDEKMEPIENPSITLSFLDVIYNREEKRKIVKEEILNQIKNKDMIAYQRKFNEWSMAFKNEAFEHEDETRLICFASKKNIEDEYFNKYVVKYRAANGMLIPYIDIQFEKALLKRITIGPLIEKEKAKETLQMYLQSKNYTDVNIRTSKVPIRY